jgi:ribosomal protein S18 acetylase RimI-like enzyme
MDFRENLQSVYLKDPCGVLSVPLWRVLPKLDDCETYLRLDDSGQPEHLEAWTEDSLLIYWDAQQVWRPTAPRSLLDAPALAVVHSRYASHMALSSDYTIQRFFRLSLTGESSGIALPERFAFEPVKLPEQAALVAEVIGRSYVHLRPSQDEVVHWLEEPVFAPDLWEWITDRRINQPAGLGIAELDTWVGEASLEWIQVLPEFRGQGLAKALVNHLVTRVAGRVPLITVSGEADNPSDAEHLYRSCGFHGQDVWWIVRRLGM